MKQLGPKQNNKNHIKPPKNRRWVCTKRVWGWFWLAIHQPLKSCSVRKPNPSHINYWMLPRTRAVPSLHKAMVEQQEPHDNTCLQEGLNLWEPTELHWSLSGFGQEGQIKKFTSIMYNEYCPCTAGFAKAKAGKELNSGCPADPACIQATSRVTRSGHFHPWPSTPSAAASPQLLDMQDTVPCTDF